MSKNVDYSSRFKKSIKRIQRAGTLNMSTLEDCIDKISNNIPLDPKFDQHKARHDIKYSKFEKNYIFHPTNRLCVVYAFDDNTVYLIDIGMHKELDLAEELIYNEEKR